jgi:hypothetical protein
MGQLSRRSCYVTVSRSRRGATRASCHPARDTRRRWCGRNKARACRGRAIRQMLAQSVKRTGSGGGVCGLDACGGTVRDVVRDVSGNGLGLHGRGLGPRRKVESQDSLPIVKTPWREDGQGVPARGATRANRSNFAKNVPGASVDCACWGGQYEKGWRQAGWKRDEEARRQQVFRVSPRGRYRKGGDRPRTADTVTLIRPGRRDQTWPRRSGRIFFFADLLSVGAPPLRGLLSGFAKPAAVSRPLRRAGRDSAAARVAAHPPGARRGSRP